MNNKYRYDRRPKKHKKRHVLIVAVLSLIVIAAVVIVIVVLINTTAKKIDSVSGPSESVGTISDTSTSLTQSVNEPDYTFNLPAQWKEIKSVTSNVQNSITWQSFVPGATNRYLTVYGDPIPATYPVNRELPVQANGSGLSYGTVSDNCANFTGTTTPKPIVPVLAKWQNVDFYCNVPNFVDNQIGTGSIGAINSVTLTGPLTGSHNFFFLYIDRNNTPDYTIFYAILGSFKAK